jgi:hypothetical protein
MRRFIYEQAPPPRDGLWRLIGQRTWVNLRGELEAEDAWDREERWQTPEAERTLLYLHGATAPLLMYDAVTKTTFHGNPMARRPLLVKGWYIRIGDSHA